MRSTVNELRQHENSPIWQDQREEIESWLEEIRNNLESDEVPLEAVPELRGSAKALRNVLCMLSVLADNLEADIEEERENGTP